MECHTILHTCSTLIEQRKKERARQAVVKKDQQRQEATFAKILQTQEKQVKVYPQIISHTTSHTRHVMSIQSDRIGNRIA